METNLNETVISFIAKQLHISEKQISSETTLFGDLGIDGDDADEFFIAFSTEFHIDFSQMDLTRHFGSENSWAYRNFLMLLKWFKLKLIREIKTKEEIAGLEPITIDELIKAVKAGKWIY